MGMASTSGARRRPQKYPDELRERAVRMVLEVQRETGEKHGAVTRIAKQLGVGAESLRNWVRQAEVDPGRRPGTSSVDAQRIAQLERENRELRRANDMAGSTGDALVCDHHLRVTNYADFNGAELVARSIGLGRLSVPCTRYTGTEVELIRPFLPQIPVLVRPDELNEPDELLAALTECALELSGEIAPERKAWQTPCCPATRCQAGSLPARRIPRCG